VTVFFTLNGETRSIDVDDDTPLLWVLRDELGLKGTKFGCGLGACGACTVHVDGEAQRSCTVPVGAVAGREVVTIEGLGGPGDLHPVQQAWVEEIVPQCGYCQPGFMMAAAALIAASPDPTDDEIDERITNVCRCATHHRVRRAIHRAAELRRRAASGTEGGTR
jgi:isoquinoline 1-oxidoreductase alpha subunit